MNYEKATFAGGCFWCLEALFKRIKGVVSVTSGYAGGIGVPKYDKDILEKTKHAETVQIQYDPNIITFEELVELFFKIHDPTTKNKQGHDVGTQYRSIVFYDTEVEKQLIENKIEELNDEHYYKDPIVTEVKKLEKFYIAEDYHQDFYSNNRDYPYCKLVIDPKIQKLFKTQKENML